MKKVFLFMMFSAFVCLVCAQGNSGMKKPQAKSFLNRKAPALKVEKWLTDNPSTYEKFVLIDFWGPSCGPCRKSIPDLNEYSKKFQMDLVVIGVAPNKEELVRGMKDPVIEYFSAIDTKKEYIGQFELTAYPYAILVDPDGIVRWEGNPMNNNLNADVIEKIITEEKAKVRGARQAWWGKSLMNQKGPELFADRWIPEKPEMDGKFTLVHFWNFHCAPCRASIPKLNEWHKQFKKDMVVLGLSNVTENEMKKITPTIEYPCIVDIKHKTNIALDLHIASYVLLIDPKGIVRWEGVCHNLTTEVVEEIIAKYK